MQHIQALPLEVPVNRLTAPKSSSQCGLPPGRDRDRESASTQHVKGQFSLYKI